MAFAESLTVRILGDSSDLKDELRDAAAELRKFKSTAEDVADIGERIGRGFSRAGAGVTALRQISGLLGQIRVQAQSLSRLPISLNVQPALQSLGQLSGAIQLIAAQLAALSAIPVSIGAVSLSAAGPAQKFASGGLVRGPAGLDRVPAWLTAGEFVLSRAATEALGTGFLEALNRGGGNSRTAAAGAVSQSSGGGTTNHFGGIRINVTRASDVNEIVRDLRLHGVRLRNRRG